MLRKLKSKKAQAVSGEYILVFFLVVGMLSAMTLFVRRALQSRVRDTYQYVVNTVVDRTREHYNGAYNFQYEPYYLLTNAFVDRDDTVIYELKGGGTTGIFKKIVDGHVSAQTFSETAPPINAD